MSVVRVSLFAAVVLIGPAVAVNADPPAAGPDAAAAPTTSSTPPAAAQPIPLNKQGTVLIDRAGGRLILKTEVVLRSGLLEMLLCKARTKEHEAILAINSDAFTIHGGLQALGADPGTPVRYTPVFKAPTGPTIKVHLHWVDEQGKAHDAPAQSWVRHSIHRYFDSPLQELPQGFTLPKDSELRYDEFNKQLLWYGPMTAAQRDELLKLSDNPDYRKGIEHFYKSSQSRELQADWVFAGSGMSDLGDGTERYQAEDGNVICVANFGDAMLDLSIPSTASNEGLMFEPYSERIPPVGTKVEVHLIPVLEKQPAPAPATESR